MRTQTHHAVQLLIAERERQIEDEGFDATHDDCAPSGEIALAAATYAVASVDWPIPRSILEENDRDGIMRRLWPWARQWFKPGDPFDRKRCLVKAGALIIAELERLERVGK